MDYAPEPVKNKADEEELAADVGLEQKWINNFFAQDEDFKIEELKLPPGINSETALPSDDNQKKKRINRRSKSNSKTLFWFKGSNSFKSSLS